MEELSLFLCETSDCREIENVVIRQIFFRFLCIANKRQFCFDLAEEQSLH